MEIIRDGTVHDVLLSCWKPDKLFTMLYTSFSVNEGIQYLFWAGPTPLVWVGNSAVLPTAVPGELNHNLGEGASAAYRDSWGTRLQRERTQTYLDKGFYFAAWVNCSTFHQRTPSSPMLTSFRRSSMETSAPHLIIYLYNIAPFQARRRFCSHHTWSSCPY